MSGRGGWMTPGVTLALLLGCAACWWGAGWLLDWLSLPEADPLGRIGAVLLLLGVAERALGHD